MAISDLQNMTFLLKETATVFVHTLDGNCSGFCVSVAIQVLKLYLDFFLK